MSPPVFLCGSRLRSGLRCQARARNFAPRGELAASPNAPGLDEPRHMLSGDPALRGERGDPCEVSIVRQGGLRRARVARARCRARLQRHGGRARIPRGNGIAAIACRSDRATHTRARHGGMSTRRSRKPRLTRDTALVGGSFPSSASPGFIRSRQRKSQLGTAVTRIRGEPPPDAISLARVSD